MPVAEAQPPQEPPAERPSPGGVLQLARPAGAASGSPRPGPAVSGISGPTDALRALSAKLVTSAARAAAVSVQVVGAVAPVPPAPAIPPLTRLPSGADGEPRGVLAIGVSTGGPNALAHVLTDLPANFPLPVLVVQHMPPTFTRLLAERLSRRTPMPVREAQGGEVVRPGEVWIAVVGPRVGTMRPSPTALRFQFEGDREPVREQTVQAALRMLLDLLDPIKRD